MSYTGGDNIAITLFQLKKIENQNTLNVNVFGWSDGSEETGEPDRKKVLLLSHPAVTIA